MFLTVLDESMGCVLGQQDEIGKKEYSLYYLSKKFTDCETWYSMLEKIVAHWLGLLSVCGSTC